MADENSTNVLRSPVLLGMIGLLVVLVLAFFANLYFLGSTASGNPHLKSVTELKGFAQAAAKNGALAAAGNSNAISALVAEKNAFDEALNNIQNNPPESLRSSVSQVAGLWGDVTPRIEAIVQKRDALSSMRENSADININLQLIQQENNKMVRTMVRTNAAPNEIVTAQRQALLIERIGHTIDKMVDRGHEQGLEDQFTRDSQAFRAVIRGFKNGDNNLVLTAVTDGEMLANLNRMEELFRSVTGNTQTLTEHAKAVAEVNTMVVAVDAGVAELSPAIDGLVQAAMALEGGHPIASFEIAYSLAGGMLLIFIVITFLVYRASNTSVSETTMQNEENQSAILQLLDELADLADGDLRVQATVTESFTGAIADSINFSIDQMRGLVAKINETSGLVSTAADQTQKSVSQLSEASQRQADEIAQVSEAVNEMAVSIDMVSYNAAESSSVAERSVDIASKGAVVVQNTIDGMDNIRGQIQETAKRIKRLGESSQEIGDIVALINDIADQTNILSLNAAIQASMAGDAGKGFAVVADEVQRLAERSGAAAKQISALVKTIQSDTNEAVSSMEQTTAEVVQGTRLAQDAGVALGEIEGVSKSLAEIIENISDAARQQAASAGKISNTMNSIQEITTATTDGTQETATAVGNLAKMTNELRSSVSGFKLPE